MSEAESTTPIRSRANRTKRPRKARPASPPQNPRTGNVLVLTPERKITTPRSNIKWPEIEKMGEFIGFVGREIESYKTAKLLIENARIGNIASNQSSSKPSLVILPQMNGSGKTTFTRKFRDVLTKSKDKNRDKLKDCYLYKNDHIIDNLRNAILININLETITNTYKNLQEALISTLLESMKEASHTKSYKRQIARMEQQDLKNVNQLLRFWNREICTPLLIVWDDVQHLENVEFLCDNQWPSIGNPIPIWSREKQLYYKSVDAGTPQALQTRLDRMYRFWDAIHTTLTLGNVFTLVCGKSPTLALIAQGYSIYGSPSYCERILMNPFTNEEIKASLITTVLTDNGDTLYDFLVERMNLSIATIDYLCEQIRSLTGGVARFVEQCFLGLYKSGIEHKKVNLNDPNSIDIFLSDKKNLDEWFTSGDIRVYDDKALTEGMRIAYIKLYLMSSFNIPFSAKNTIPIKGLEKPLNINELLTVLGLWTEEVERDTVRLIFPKIVILQQQLNMKDIMKYRFPLLAPLQSSGIYLDRGETLEILVLNIVYFVVALRLEMAGYKKTWGDVFGDVFKGTFVENLIIKLNLNHPISFLPQIINSTGGDSLGGDKIRELIDKPWSSTVPKDSWPEILEHIFDDNTFGKPYKKSHSQDLSYRASKTCIIAFVIKNWGTEAFTWKVLQEEIDKCYYTIENEDNKTLTVLVLVRTLGTEIDEWVNSQGGIGRLGYGDYYFNKSAKSLIQSTSKKVTIAVHQDMEIVLLGKAAFNNFIGDENIKILKLLADKNINMDECIGILYNWVSGWSQTD
jgi:hypothetical protein